MSECGKALGSSRNGANNGAQSCYSRERVTSSSIQLTNFDLPFIVGDGVLDSRNHK